MSTPLLQLSDLHVFYGGIHALHGISLEVAAGEIVTLIGANGAGKSTTLRAISGLVRASSGTVRLEGRELQALPPHEIVALGVSQSPEGRGVFANLTVRENLDLGAYLRRDRDALSGDLERVFAHFPKLKARLSQAAGTLSGGEQQMLAMGRALMARPKVLLLDEPSLGLAPQLVETIFRVIREINQEGTTLLLVEQNAHQALQVAHRGYVLETGSIVMSGPAPELLRSEAVRKAYLGEG